MRRENRDVYLYESNTVPFGSVGYPEEPAMMEDVDPVLEEENSYVPDTSGGDNLYFEEQELNQRMEQEIPNL
jgi:hypothetical protein